MNYKMIELELYTAMNEYNKYGDDFNKVIINHIDSVVKDKMVEFREDSRKINLKEINLLISKCSEISFNCNLLLNDLRNIDKINNLKKSIEELEIIEEDTSKNIVNILGQLLSN
ncbi:MAG: hypothetical protein ACLU4S_04805 [Clostridium perfringens]